MSAPVAPARSSSVFRVDVTVLELQNVPEQHTSVRVKVSRGETIQLTRVLLARDAPGTVVFSEKLSLLATLQRVDGDACFASKVRVAATLGQSASCSRATPHPVPVVCGPGAGVAGCSVSRVSGCDFRACHAGPCAVRVATGR